MMPSELAKLPSSSPDDTVDTDTDLFGDNDQFRLKLFGHLTNSDQSVGHSGAINNRKEDESSTMEANTQVYYYRTRLCYYIPRLLYLVALILLMYVILWLLCAMPQILGFKGSNLSTSNNRRIGNGLAIISANSKCRKV